MPRVCFRPLIGVIISKQNAPCLPPASKGFRPLIGVIISKQYFEICYILS